MSLFTLISQRKPLQTDGIDWSGVRIRGGLGSGFSDQGLLLGINQETRDLGQCVLGKSAGQILGLG